MVSCLGSLVQSRCGEGGALQTDIAVCGELSQSSGHTGFAPLTGVCFPHLHCSGFQLLYMERALRCLWFQFWVLPKSADSAGTALCAFPGGSGSGGQELDGRTLPGCGAPSPLRSPSLSFRRRRLGACTLSLAATLPVDVDHPESQEVFG